MITIEQHERLDQLTHLLDERKSSPEPPHWLINHPEYDQGSSFCWSCVKELISNPVAGDNWDGGFCCEEDECEHCEKCGKLLEYTLTDYGVDEELEHFTEYPPENLDDADECYHLARIAHGVYTDDQKLKFLKIMENIADD
jgi:hypothetical protein